MNKNTEERFLCKSEIAGRTGWSQAAIKKFLGPHDIEKPNPHYKKAAPLKLYYEKRIMEAETTPEFDNFCTQNAKRKESAKKGTETKILKAIEYANNVVIIIPD